jgi:NADPH-dependent curcumin reductase
MVNKKMLLVQRPTGMVAQQNFNIIEDEITNLADGEILIKNEYISIDPAMRGWMNEGTTYIKGVAIGEVMRAFAVGTIVESKNTNFSVGDCVQGLLGVQQYCISDGTQLSKIQLNDTPMSWHIGLLGMPGLTAYFGLLDKAKPVAGDIVLVSGAAGMVGSLVGQIAKLKGCTIIGIAGGKDKCDYIKNELGFDFAIDYKTENVAQKIKEFAPNGINIYFDNVGGSILDDALLNLAIGARVVICGAISQYNETSFTGLKYYMKIISARATLMGIIVFDYFPRAGEAITDLSNWIGQGKIKYKEHIIDGIENFPTALQMLFTGKNNGKLIVKP